MASSKEYIYQIKGNKLSLVEKDYSTSDGLNYSYVDGAGLDIPSGSTLLKSPLSDIDDGLELEYAYSPIYARPTSYDQNDQVFIIGWIVQDGYLAFVTDVVAATGNTTSTAFSWATWAGVTTPVANTHILIKLLIFFFLALRRILRCLRP